MSRGDMVITVQGRKYDFEIVASTNRQHFISLSKQNTELQEDSHASII
jgi:hypothetical protein